MDLASYYQGLFIQSSAPHEEIRAGHVRFGNFSTFFTPAHPSSNNPCWDLDSLHEEEIYRFSNTNYNSSFCKSSPSKSFDCSSDLSDTCSPTRSSGRIDTAGDIGLCTPSSENYLQSNCLLPRPSTKNESAFRIPRPATVIRTCELRVCQ